MLTPSQWRAVHANEFEQLAVEHVSDIFPDLNWRSTATVNDGGRDAVGISTSDQQPVERYWMEAKHHPGRTSIGKYTVDTHLISAFFARGEISRLHLVTSGLLSSPFLGRATDFGEQHGFTFSFSDRDTVETWLQTGPDIIRACFKGEADEILALLEKNDQRPVLPRAIILPDGDRVGEVTVPSQHLLPGRKYRMLVVLPIAKAISDLDLPFTIRWSPNPGQVSILAETKDNELVLQIDPRREPFVSIPFRLTGLAPIPAPTLHSSTGQSIATVPLGAATPVRHLASPLVGQHAEQCLLKLASIIKGRVAQSRPFFLLSRGPAGSGKSRLAEEIGDDAAFLGFNLLQISFSGVPRAQEEKWRQFFCWVFGLGSNPFEFSEEDVLSRRLAALGTLDLEFISDLKQLLYASHFDPSLFSIDTLRGRRFSIFVVRALEVFLTRPLLVHFDDVHHLGRDEIAPLVMLHHIVETADSLPLLIIASARNDETVTRTATDLFEAEISTASSSATEIFKLGNLSSREAGLLVQLTMKWPELQAKESQTLNKIIERAGTNPFCLMQLLHHIAFDHGAVAFSTDGSTFLVNIDRFKQALEGIPRNIGSLLEERFRSLRESGRTESLKLLCSIAILGRSAAVEILSMFQDADLEQEQIEALLSYGYLKDASTEQLLLSHDILAEALLLAPETGTVALHMAKLLEGKANAGLDDAQKADIFYHAGPPYYTASWALAQNLVEDGFRRQEYVYLRSLLQRLETMAEVVSTLHYSVDLEWKRAVVEQHSGNTLVALERFAKVRETVISTMHTEGEALDLYVRSFFESANQHYLRAEPTKALAFIDEGLAILSTAEEDINIDRIGLLALGHNRRGAVLHLANRIPDSLESLRRALSLAITAEDHYLAAHTYRDIASAVRFFEPGHAESCLRWAERRLKFIEDKSRLKVLLDVAAAYAVTATDNNHWTRSQLLAISTDAIRRGFFFQATSALLIFCSCCFVANRWQEPLEALKKCLDLITVTEDIKSRIFASHYISVVQHAAGKKDESRDWAWKAAELLSDPMMYPTPVGRAIIFNRAQTASGRSPAENLDGLHTCGDLKYAIYNRG